VTSSGRPEETFALPAWAANPKDYKLSRQDLETGFQPVENGCSVHTQGLPETELPAGKISLAISHATGCQPTFKTGRTSSEGCSASW